MDIIVFDLCSVAEYADRSAVYLIAGVDDLTITDVAVAGTEWNFSVNDLVAITESYDYNRTPYYIDVYEDIAIWLDIVYFGSTPKWISVAEDAAISESVELLDIVVDGSIHLDFISVSEEAIVRKDITFDSILRSYPFNMRVISNVKSAEFESGVIQERDLWGRYKTRFEITFPPMTRYEALDVMFFFKANKGKQFSFNCPVDSQTYTCRIVDEEFVLERRYYNSYFGNIVVEEVF